jgi:hypothetical protein
MHKIYSLIILLGCSFIQASAQDAGDDIIGKEVSIPAPFVKKNQKKYSVEIIRRFSTPEEERLLNIAESVYPDESEIRKKCEAPSRSAESGVEPRWRCGTFDGIRFTFAITKGAVGYYVKVTDEFRRKEFERTSGVKMESSSLSYSAEIVFRQKYTFGSKSFDDVYEVSMNLGWSQYCGNMCGMTFGSKRTVILDKNGSVLLVTGDGDSQGVVS